MLEVLAINYEICWVFLKEEERLYFIRPPFKEWSETDITEDIVEFAVSKQGFVAVSLFFPSKDILIAYLNKLQVLAMERMQSQDLSDSKIIHKIMQGLSVMKCKVSVI